MTQEPEVSGTVFLTVINSQFGIAPTRLLIDSLRTFGGEMGDCPFWVFEVNPENAPCRGLEAAGVQIIPLEVADEVKPNWFSSKVTACAKAEVLAGPEIHSLVWVSPNCLILQPPLLFQLPPYFDAALRPVHHRNIGLGFREPLDEFWQGVYAAVGIEDTQTEVETFVENERLRAYYNSHLIAINPAKGIFSRWYKVFQALVQDQAFQESACNDEAHQIFLHQAVLSALIPTILEPWRIMTLPPEYSYPYNLHADVPTERKASALNELVCINYENRPLHPDKVTDIAINEPLTTWLAENIHTI